jgi:hypothetical protein
MLLAIAPRNAEKLNCFPVDGIIVFAPGSGFNQTQMQTYVYSPKPLNPHYQVSKWVELMPASSARPLADRSDTTDWTLPQYYTTILLGDVDGDGIAELVARGAAGVETYRWQEEQREWVRISGPSILSEESFNDESSYATVQMADLHGDGKQLLVVRAASGVQTFEGKGGDWHLLNASALFSDDSGNRLPNHFRTFQVASWEANDG